MERKKNNTCPIRFDSPEWERKLIFVEVDKWTPLKEQELFTTIVGAVIAPVSQYYGLDQNTNNTIDYFIMSSKKCYNSPLMRTHLCKYLNYFEAFYDMDREYFVIMCQMKYLIDYYKDYRKEAFMYDLKRYILSPTILQKTEAMTEDNYSLELKYNNINNPSLQYSDKHAKLLMQISILMNLSIPLLTHFAYSRKITNIDDFLFEAFDVIMNIFNVEMDSKLFETSLTNVKKSEQGNAILWAKQDIRGKNVTTHSLSSLENIILNIMPKYVFNQNVISMNYSSIQLNANFQITDISYEFSYIPLSSSKRDEDNQSDFDKFESTLVRQNESLYLQNKFASAYTMSNIDSMFGPFDQGEIDFYMKELKGDNCINPFQKQLIFLMFYKFFGDTISPNAINKIDYIKLTIASRQILQQNYMVMLPYIISGKVEKLVTRKSINKKEMVKMEMSPNFEMVKNKYQNDKIIKHILSIVATIISSEFRIIDYNNKELHGKKIEIIPDLIIEEALMFIILI